MKFIVISLLLTAISAGAAPGMELSAPPSPGMPKNLPLQSPLYDAIRFAAAETLAPPALRSALADHGIALSEAGEIHVEIVGPKGGQGISSALVESFGARMDTRWRHRLDCWVPLDRLLDLARALPPGFVIENANSLIACEVGGEGAAVMNSAAWPDGNGIGVAVCDLNFGGFSVAVANGDAPVGATLINYSDDPFEFGDTHGTGCTEAVYDHVPASSYRLYRLDSMTDLGEAVLDAAEHNVRIMSVSLGRAADGWHDDEGDTCEAANEAGESGMLFFVAMGNHAQEHYQGYYNTNGDDDGWHNFAGPDETIDIIVAAGGSVHFVLQWDRGGPDEFFDYDLYLFDTEGEEIASSAGGGEGYEWFTWTNGNPGDALVHLCVYNDNSSPTEFEVTTDGPGAWQEHIVSESSNLSPCNATHPNVLAVGAVYHGDYDEGIIADYSSQGPSNDGLTLPDLVAATGTNCCVCGGEMHGTSNAAPNAAGAAAALWCADGILITGAIQWLCLLQADVFKDWGDPDQDNIFGWGGLYLVDYAPNTLWVSRYYGNYIGNRQEPFYYVADALVWAQPDGRLLLFPGGHFPESVTIDQHVTVETVEYPAYLGD